MPVNKSAVFLLTLLPLSVFADNKQPDVEYPASELPDGELLEFIAEFEPLDGQWLDPIQLNTIFAENHNGKDNEQKHN
jgi:hypothetical protein